MDEEGIPWNDAWAVTSKTFCYTNHTLLAEALENGRSISLAVCFRVTCRLSTKSTIASCRRLKFPTPVTANCCVRRRLLRKVPKSRFVWRTSVFVGSSKVNGVSALHSELLHTQTMAQFDKIYPGKFCNVTNGITHRRWLMKANPELSALITEKTSAKWKTDLSELKHFEPAATDKDVQKRFMEIKHQKKEALCQTILDTTGYYVSPDSMFDVQIKRLHMYKRQLLKVMHIIYLYNQIKENPSAKVQSRTFIFAAKAAPAYLIAKSVIKLINTMAEVINNDVDVAGRLKVVFLPDYNVSLAEKIIPAADVSEQISTAGLEASGTGNMKLSLNGALTVGTWDGANIEIAQNVGEENIFIFGHRTEELAKLRAKGYSPKTYLEKSPELQNVLAAIRDNIFDPSQPDLFRDIYNDLTEHGDHYFYMADFEDYIKCNESVDALYATPDQWAEKAILNVARMGWFSSDRSIQDYCDDIWHLEPSPVKIPEE